ncbi:BLOC-1 related complex subunit 6 [Cyprinodon tularosa]|uniref:BLOC-1 related complex subunit 6 n=1 Tax=Cyprinodon tularosa TaxID=77115 RepID=UPI0018E2878D|nr:BLOC-1 related complex subunit 6 [Cyprinodon tularosa]XP_038149787.1 BLOC-1 related complex subunit 6 [Cyprinodon tularosa]
MSLSPVIGTEVPEAANGVATTGSLENDSHVPVSVKYGGSRLPANGGESMGGSSGHTENHVDTANRLPTEESNSDKETDINQRTSSLSLHCSQAVDPSTHDGADRGNSESKDISKASETEDVVLMWGSAQQAELKDHCQQGGSDIAERHQVEEEIVERSLGIRGEEEDGEKEKQDMETDEKNESRWRNTGGRTEELSQHYSSSAPTPSTSSSSPQPTHLTSDDTPCPPHVMAQVWVRNNRGMQDSKSLDEISQACGGSQGARGGGRSGQSEGRRATISSALELEGTVSHEGDLTNFITKNLEQKIKMSSKPSLDCSDSDCSGPIYRSRGLTRRPADIPPIDPTVLVDLQRHTQEVAHSVEMMMKSLNGTIQNMTALSVGYIQTYRDSVDSLGESVDMSIKGMYTLMARCEELDRSMQPIHTLAAQIRDIKRTLDALEAICK